MNTVFLCPVCHSPLTEGKTFKCSSGHSFDLSAEGYINLAVGKSGSGDSRDMCRARRDFLSAGYYLPFAKAIAQAVTDYSAGNCILDAGCGEGFYLRVLRDSFSNGTFTGVDLAKDSVRFAAKAEKNQTNKIDYAVAGIFDLPLEDDSYDTVLSVFAPVPEAEAFRVLRHDGIMIVCHPGEKHLSGMKDILYSSPYDNDIKLLSYSGFHQIDERHCKYSVSVAKNDIPNLFMMTPYYWKTSVEDKERLYSCGGFDTDLDFIITVFKSDK